MKHLQQPEIRRQKVHNSDSLPGAILQPEVVAARLEVAADLLLDRRHRGVTENVEVVDLAGGAQVQGHRPPILTIDADNHNEIDYRIAKLINHQIVELESQHLNHLQ